VEGRNQGIYEIKCLYSARTLTPKAAYQEIRFCKNMVDGNIILKIKHNYYYYVSVKPTSNQKKDHDVTFVFGLLMECQWRELLKKTHFGKQK